MSWRTAKLIIFRGTGNKSPPIFSKKHRLRIRPPLVSEAHPDDLGNTIRRFHLRHPPLSRSSVNGLAFAIRRFRDGKPLVLRWLAIGLAFIIHWIATIKLLT